MTPGAAGLVVGKPLGVFGTAFLLAEVHGATLDEDLAWRDVLGVALLAGIGFTVSLLIGELAFGYGTANGAMSRSAFCGSVVAGVLASVRFVEPQTRLVAEYIGLRRPTRTTTDVPTSTSLDRTDSGRVRKLRNA